ncbi:hypothetical protein A20C1_01971 [marine actinobacterium PHSC20C1]|nr:hypothetical protein A20C1_01971 [marine actinobacterium PHSC20C1]
MAQSVDGRVAVYIDFDNIVISRYNQKHGNGQFQRDKARTHNAGRTTTSAVGTKLTEAEVDVEEGKPDDCNLHEGSHRTTGGKNQPSQAISPRSEVGAAKGRL